MTAAEPTTHTLDAPGATLTYDVRTVSENTAPTLFLIGSPMGAAGFGTLASHFTDRTVVTYDPRGSERSELTYPDSVINPDVHADDLHRIITEIGVPVDLFASSGGAVNALALVAKYPDDLRTLVAHEPPLASLLPDRQYAEAVTQAIHDTYQRDGWGAAMAHFVAVVSHRGLYTADDVAQSPPDPASFGFPTDDDGSRNDPMLGQTIINTTHYQPDFDALRKAGTRIIPAAGTESDGEMASRGAHALAEHLPADLALFPSNHGGFLGGEYGQTGEPGAFAARLAAILGPE